MDAIDESLAGPKTMDALCRQLREVLSECVAEGEAKYTARHRERGKMLARERVALLLDRGSAFLELMPLAGYGRKHMTAGASLVIGLGKVHGIWCLIDANIPTLKGGALNALSVAKSRRMDSIARENQLPVIYLTESAGADLSQQAEIFVPGGESFREISRRSRQGIPSITVVFGSSTAGGAYIPGMSDYVVMVAKQARSYLAGPPLVKMALGEDSDDESLGGANMHASKSGLCDFLVHSEREGLACARRIMATLKHNYQATSKPCDNLAPLYPASELNSIVPTDGRRPYDICEVFLRLIDRSEFFEFKSSFGENLVTGFASIGGHPVGLLGNNGVIDSNSANKGAHFIQLCQKQCRPLVFFQNVTGFMVGRDAEENGIIKNGAKLINAVANTELPCLTVLVGNSYGAGNYGMCGRAYNPRFLFAWPNAKLAVMGAEQLTGVLAILQNQKAKRGEKASPSDAKAARKALHAKLESESNAIYCSSRLWDDGVIEPCDTRKVLNICLDAIAQSSAMNAGEWGVFRM